MNFLVSIKTCFKKYADFKGRASRSEFWYFFLLLLLGSILSLVSYVYFFDNSEIYYSFSDTLYNLLYYSLIGIICLFYGIIAIPLIAVTIRRIHDVGHSGLIILIFVVGFIVSFILQNEIIPRIVFVLLGIFLSQKSKGKNQFGPPPKK
tara:strand:- start:38 stop:484 length:447 start_codon:yes stop_codon:yes gene_type:complete